MEATVTETPEHFSPSQIAAIRKRLLNFTGNNSIAASIGLNPAELFAVAAGQRSLNYENWRRLWTRLGFHRYP
jgi:hypothetical protein